MYNVTSTAEKQLTPGWLNGIRNNKGKIAKYRKRFYEDGTIEESELDEN
jgi:hypothetical protein